MRVFNIRAGRKEPGLKAQHILSAGAVRHVTGGTLRGAEPGSRELIYLPGAIRPGRYFFDVGTAGSTALVFQALLPVLLYANSPTHLTIRGGTHVEWSPSADYLEKVFLPILSRMGVDISLKTITRGYYPGGGGTIEAAIRPVGKLLAPLDITERGSPLGIEVTSAVSNLPLSIAERQLKSALAVLGNIPDVTGRCVEAPSPGRGTTVFILASYTGTTAGFSAIGARGKRAEDVGAEAASECVEFGRSRGAVDAHLSDQLPIYMALSSGQSSFTTPRASNHLATNIHVIERFLPVRFIVEEGGGECRVSVAGASFAPA